MNKHEEYQYLDIMQEIIDKGIRKPNRTGVDTFYLFCRSMRFSLRDGIFPLLTTKKTFLRGIAEELFFFLRGDTNTKHLEEKGVNIWKGNTSRESLDKNNLTMLPDGDLGCGYSFQWRNFGGEHPCIPETKGLKGKDQIAEVLYKLQNTPLDRRIVIDAWCANQIKYMALPPCHVYYQFVPNIVDNELDCHMTQRSCDYFLGVAFNIASLALLTNIMAKFSGFKPGEIHWTGVDVHLYENHFEAAKEQISREPYPFPKIKLNIDGELNLERLGNLTYDNIELIDYKSHAKIEAPMAV